MASFQQIRRPVQAAIDDGVQLLVASATGTSATVNALINGTTGASTSDLDGRWVYVAVGTGAGAQVKVRPGSYVPNTGTFSVDPPWTAPTSAEIDLTEYFPVKTLNDTDTSYQSIINAAMRQKLIADRIDVTTVANQQSYSLGAFALWMTDQQHVTGLYDPPLASGFQPRVSRMKRGVGWDLVFDGGSPAIHFHDRAYTTNGATFQVEVMRPAVTLINGVESAVGLVAEGDTVRLDIQEAVELSLLELYRVLMHRSPGRPTGNWSERWKTQLAYVQQNVPGFIGARATAAPQAAA